MNRTKIIINKTEESFRKCEILFFFLHRHSQVPASMPSGLRLFRSFHPPAALTLRCAVQACCFNRLFSRMAKHGPVHGMQRVLGNTKQKTTALPDARAALTRKTGFSMRHSRVIERKDKSSAAEGEARPGYRNQERNLNYDSGMPTRLSDEPPKKDHGWCGDGARRSYFT